MESSIPARVVRVQAGAAEEIDDAVAAEAPFELRLGATPLAVVMRTPGDDADLALGFALTEGIVLNPAEVAELRPVAGQPGDQRMELVLAPGVAVDAEQFRRNSYTTSSCGVCGKASIDAVRVAARPLPAGPVIEPATLLGLPAVLEAHQHAFAATGGLHAAAAFTAGGELVAIREDVGRHNAVDKLVGALARTRWPLPELAVMVSGRVSFEIVQKAAVAGLGFVAGVSAASSLAVDLAAELGATLVGFLRRDSFNLYAGAQRLRH